MVRKVAGIHLLDGHIFRVQSRLLFAYLRIARTHENCKAFAQAMNRAANRLARNPNHKPAKIIG